MSLLENQYNLRVFTWKSMWFRCLYLKINIIKVSLLENRCYFLFISDPDRSVGSQNWAREAKFAIGSVDPGGVIIPTEAPGGKELLIQRPDEGITFQQICQFEKACINYKHGSSNDFSWLNVIFYKLTGFLFQ